MAVSGDIRSRVRGMMVRDKSNRIKQAAVGNTASTLPNSAHTALQSYGYDIISDYLRLEQDLAGRFIDYQGMDEYPETSAVLHIYADDATQPDTPSDRRLWVTSPDKDIEVILNDLLHRTLRIDEEIWSMARSLCKWGNNNEEIIVGEEGVIGLNHLPAHTVRRVEGMRGELYGYVQDYNQRSGYSPREFQQILAKRVAQASEKYQTRHNQAGPPVSSDTDNVMAFENWQVAHFRLRLKERQSLYGYSVLEPARWIWKRLMLLEDSALIYRLQRASERYIYYVNTGNNPANEAIRLLNLVRHQHKKKKFINPTTNEIDLKYTLLAPDDDIFIASPNGDPSTRVDVLSSAQWQHMDDIEYFLRKMFSALLVPRAYLAHEEGINRAILSSEDVRFARTVMRVQRALKLGLEHICRVHLAALGVPAHVVDFEVQFTVPSAIFELAQIEVKNARADLGARTLEHTSLRYVLENVYGLNDEAIEVIFKQRQEDAERMGDNLGRQEKNMMSHMGGMGGGMGGGFGGGGGRPRPAPIAASRIPQGVDPRGYSPSAVSPRVHLQRQLFTHPGGPSVWSMLNSEMDRRSKGQDAKLQALLSQNRMLSSKVAETRGLLQDIYAATRTR